MYEVTSVQLLLSSVYLYWLGFKQKNYDTSAECTAEEAPPVNNRIVGVRTVKIQFQTPCRDTFH